MTQPRDTGAADSRSAGLPLGHGGVLGELVLKVGWMCATGVKVADA
jgi:hypothetical protein